MAVCPIRKNLRHLKRNLIKRGVPTGDMMLMTEFVLKDIFFEFGVDVKQQLLGTAIGKNLYLLIPEYIWIGWISSVYLLIMECQLGIFCILSWSARTPLHN